LNEIEEILITIDFGKVSGNDLTRLLNFIKYDVPDPKERLATLQSKNIKKHSLENYQLLYGNTIGKEKYNEFISKMNTNTEYWIKRGYTLVEAKEIIRKLCYDIMINNLDKIGKSLAKCIKKYGEIKGYEHYRNWLKNNQSKYFKNASKISLKYWTPLIEYAKSLKISKYNYGVEGNAEFFLTDIKNGKSYFYDLVFPELKLIFEYNGEHVHPNKEKLSETQWNNWRLPWDATITADIKYLQDTNKKDFAEINGFKIVYIWSSDNFNEKLSEAKLILLNRYNEMKLS
jgi:hypothetical protein